MKIFKKIRAKIENKRNSRNIFWRALVWLKDFIFYKTYKSRNNYVVVCDSKKFMFVCVFKNASSSLRKLAYETDGLSWEQGEQKKISIKQSRAKKYRNYIKFAVLRDPMERFLSFYRNKILAQDHWFKEKCQEKNIQIDSLKSFVDFAKKEIDNKMTCDLHLLPQSLYYKKSDVDYIVPIEKLSIFIKNKLKFDDDLKINSSNHIPISIGIDDAKELEKIKKLYEKDYKIRPNY